MKTLSKIVLAACLTTIMFAMPAVSQATPTTGTVNYVLTVPQGTNPPVTYVNVTAAGTTNKFTLVAPSGSGPLVAASALTAMSTGLNIMFEANNGTLTTFYITK